MNYNTMNCKRIQIGLPVLILLMLLVNISIVCNFYVNTKATDSISNQILHQNRRLELAFKTNDMMKVASFYSDSGELFGENLIIAGIENSDAYWMSLKDGGISWNLENIKIDAYDSLPVQQGVSKLVYMFQGQEQLSVVRFTLVWKRINDNWLIEVDHYSII